MHVGIQTISWGPEPADGIEAMLKAIHKVGYEGVELFQHPEPLGSPDCLYRMFQGFNLKLIGLAGGSLRDKAKLIDDLRALEDRLTSPDAKATRGKVVRFHHHHPYVYLDTWKERECTQLMADGYVLALHPHMFKPIQTAQEAEKYLQQNPKLRVIVDTAHLTVAGDDVVAVIEHNYDRIAAIHVKDWTSEFGRAYQFYSRGFGVELGHADVQLHNILQFLVSKDYDGWLIVEQDAVDEPVQTAQQSRQWLKKYYSI